MSRQSVTLVFWLIASVSTCEGLRAQSTGPIVVDRLWIPAQRLTEVFPKGSALVTMPSPDFESLVRDANLALTQAAQVRPRLLRARHVVRWIDGRLDGQSTFEFESSSGERGPIPIEPWTSAIVSLPSSGVTLRSSDAGQLAAWLPPASTQASCKVDWTQGARDGAGRQLFDLGLPRLDLTSIELVLPDDRVLVDPESGWDGPFPADHHSHHLWTYRGPTGTTPLRLRIADTKMRIQPATIAVSGPTQIVVDEAAASWTTNWTIDAGTATLQPLTVWLDPGVEILGVEGTALESFSIAESLPPPEAGASGRGIKLRWRAGTKSVAKVAVRGLAPVPGEGAWKIPGVSIPDAIWTGGRTTLTLGPERILQDQKPRSAVLVENATGQPLPDGSVRLVYETTGSASPAELFFRRPAPRARAEVRGQVLLGPDMSRLEATILWAFDGGRPFILHLDLPNGWTPESLTISGVSGAVAWQSQPRVGGGLRVIVPVPPMLDLSRAAVLSLTATYTGDRDRPPDSTLPMPRLLPVDTQVIDERWVAWAERGYSLRPVDVRGLAWIKPETIGLEPPALADTGLAWRWVASDYAGALYFSRKSERPKAEIRQSIRIAGDRAWISARLEVDAGQAALRSLPLLSSLVPAGQFAWHLESRASRTPLVLRASPLAASDQPSLLGELELPAPQSGKFVVVGQADWPWNGAESLPLLGLPRSFQSRTSMLVGLDRIDRSTIRSRGIRILEPELASALDQPAVGSLTPAGATPDGRTRWTHAFSFDGSPVDRSLQLSTERLELAGQEGVIREAVLTTRPAVDDLQPSHLDLIVVPAGVREFRIELPPGASLERLLVDGKSESARRDGASYIIPLPAVTGGRPSFAISIDYRVPPPEDSVIGEVFARPPRFSFPCLSLSWQVLTPEPSVWLDLDPSLTDSRAAGEPGWYHRIYNATTLPKRPALRPPGRSTLQSIENASPPLGRDGVTLGEILLGWDAHSGPLVVDRLALLGAGWSSRSRILPTSDASQQSLLALLQASGLELLETEGLLLITARGRYEDVEPGAGDRALPSTLRSAVIHTADDTGRFLAAPRWVVQDLSGPSPSGMAADPRIGNSLWLGSMGWKPEAARLQTLDPAAWTTRLVLGFFSSLTLGLAFLRLNARFSLQCGFVLLAGTTLFVLRNSPAWIPVLAGVLIGMFAVLGIGVGHRFKRRQAQSRSAAVPGPSPARSAITTVLRAGLGLAITLAATAYSHARRDDPPADASTQSGPSILAVLPTSSSGRPEQVWLRRDDADRLRGLAARRAGSVAPDKRLWAESVTHQINQESDGTFTAISRFVLWSRSDSPAVWNLPVGDATGLSASLDGQPQPLDLAPEGRTAAVWTAAEGRRTLIFRRTLNGGARPDREGLSLPVNPVPQAQLLPTAVGPAAAGSPFGPVDLLEIAPPVTPARESLPHPGTSLLILWDALPAGDRIRAKVVFPGRSAGTQVQLTLGDGLLLRSSSAAGLSDSCIIPAPEGGSTWLGRFDSSSDENRTIDLEFWKPAPSSGSSRAVPVVDVLGTPIGTAILVLRRPSGWMIQDGPTPRLVPAAVPELAQEWTAHAMEEALELAGAYQLEAGSKVAGAVMFGPQLPRFAVRNEVELTLDAGRLDFKSLSRLRGPGLATRGAEVALPAECQLTRVSSDGLTGWSRPSPDKLLLRFDGATASASIRSVQLEGWIPALGSMPSNGRGANHDIPIPWPRWTNGRLEPSQLTVMGPPGVTPRVSIADGTIVPDPAVGPGSAGVTARRFRVLGDPLTSRLVWAEEPPRAQVSVGSMLTLYPGEVGLESTLRYKVSGGSLASLSFSLPTDWSSSAELDLGSLPARVDRDDREGLTYWTVTLEQPIWGSQDLQLHSRRPYNADRGVNFPALIPRGRGQVSTLLMVANATGRPLVTEGSGAQQVAEEQTLTGLLNDPRSAYPLEAYTPLSENWNLKLRLDTDPAVNRDDAGRSRVCLADVTCAVAPDGTLWGQSEYHLGQSPGAFLGIAVPTGVEPLSAGVDGLPVRLLQGKDRTVMVPLEGTTARRILLTWRSRPLPFAEGGLRASLPAPYSVDPVRTSVSVRAPGGVHTHFRGGGLTACGPETSLILRAEAIRDRIVEDLSKFDRSSARERASLTSLLIQFDLICRQADRSIQAQTGSANDPSTGAAAAPPQQSLDRSRAQVTEALQLRGLETVQLAARQRAGNSLTDAPPSLTLDPVPLPVSLRQQLIGVPGYSWSPALPAGATPELIWNPTRAAKASSASSRWLPGLGLPAILAILGLLCARAITRLNRWFVLGGFLALVSVLVAVGSAAGISGLAGLLIGRMDRASR